MIRGAGWIFHCYYVRCGRQKRRYDDNKKDHSLSCAIYCAVRFGYKRDRELYGLQSCVIKSAMRCRYCD